MNLDLALQTFIHEGRELLTDMENALLVIEQSEEKTELVNAIFRAAHTIKGSSGLFSLDHIVAFTHVVESLLDHVRDGKLEIADQMVAVLLSCCDHIGSMIEAVAAGQTGPDEEMILRGAPLLDQLRSHMAPAKQAVATIEIALDDVDVTDRIESEGGSFVHQGR